MRALALATLGLALAAAPAGAQVTVPTLPVPVSVPAAPAAAGQAGGQALVGVFEVAAGQCASGGVTSGSFFRMVQPRGTPAAGPFVQNGDSPCGDKTFTPLRPGTDKGLVTGGHQPHPDPAFTPTGAGRADRVTQPQVFFGVAFATATNPTDPQTGAAAPAPSITASGGSLSGDLRAFAAAWNNQHFNQGSPKPDGSKPGNTAGPTGTFDAATGRYTLEWSSQIVGGPFNDFTGVWHLEGTFRGSGPTGTTAAPAPSGSGGSGGATASAGAGGRARSTPATGGPVTPRTGADDLAGPAGALLALGGAGLALARRARRG